MSEQATTAIYLDTRRKKNNNTYPLKLKVTYKGKRRYYSINDISLTKKDYQRMISDIANRGRLRTILIKANKFKSTIDSRIEKMDTFSFEELSGKKQAATKNELPNDVFKVYEMRMKELENENRIKTLISYRTSMNSIYQFVFGKKVTGKITEKLPFEKITTRFLHNYENWLNKRGNSTATRGIYLRTFRIIVNIGMKKGIINKYPFSNFKIQTAPARKIALDTTELQQLFNYETSPNRTRDYYFDLWRFSYLVSGINVTDIALLKYSNIGDGFIYFTRSKTGKNVKVSLTEKAVDIIDKWGNTSNDKYEYIFPILNAGYSAKQQVYRISDIIKRINKNTKDICTELEINKNVTTYVARHSYATHLMRHSLPVGFISKQLGHTDIKTTVNYLADFEVTQMKEWQTRTVDFNL